MTSGALVLPAFAKTPPLRTSTLVGGSSTSESHSRLRLSSFFHKVPKWVRQVRNQEWKERKGDMRWNERTTERDKVVGWEYETRKKKLEEPKEKTSGTFDFNRPRNRECNVMDGMGKNTRQRNNQSL